MHLDPGAGGVVLAAGDAGQLDARLRRCAPCSRTEVTYRTAEPSSNSSPMRSAAALIVWTSRSVTCPPLSFIDSAWHLAPTVPPRPAPAGITRGLRRHNESDCLGVCVLPGGQMHHRGPGFAPSGLCLAVCPGAPLPAR